MATQLEEAYIESAIPNKRVSKKILDMIDAFDNGGTGEVTSVNGQDGTVLLDTDDIPEGSTNEYYTEAKVDANVDPKIENLQDQIDAIPGATKFQQTFTLTDWQNIAGQYEIQVLAATHSKGVNPETEVYEDISSALYEKVNVSITNSSVGDVTIRVSILPDNRFIGKIVII